jgi:hypothetical protein
MVGILLKDSARKAMWAKILKDKLITHHAVLTPYDYTILTKKKPLGSGIFLFGDSGKTQFAFANKINGDQWDLANNFTRLTNSEAKFILDKAKFRENNW